ncbi:MAG: hypothetical protein KAH56_02485 [Candidatus Krumholzibacteria bacterium]|nr:hypothetical protein [Candidatus Krumholzibacteria bacterium]
MRNLVWNKSVIRFQGLLGFVVLATVGLVAFSHLRGLAPEERPVRAQAEARELASATLDYHADTGQWPRNPEGKIDFTPLLGRQPGKKAATMTAGAANGGLGGLGSLSETSVPAGHQGVGRCWLEEIPLDPWGGPYLVLQKATAIAVLSTGPNRKLDTEPSRIWDRPANINPCDGDDVGIVLEIDSGGGF